jgi:hypothetical protein
MKKKKIYIAHNGVMIRKKNARVTVTKGKDCFDIVFSTYVKDKETFNSKNYNVRGIAVTKIKVTEEYLIDLARALNIYFE